MLHVSGGGQDSEDHLQIKNLSMNKRELWLRAIAAAALSASMGCGARRPAAGTYVVPRACIQKVELSDKTECSGPDPQHLRCTAVTLTTIP